VVESLPTKCAVCGAGECTDGRIRVFAIYEAAVSEPLDFSRWLQFASPASHWRSIVSWRIGGEFSALNQQLPWTTIDTFLNKKVANLAPFE
jgi:hypothetical protein